MKKLILLTLPLLTIVVFFTSCRHDNKTPSNSITPYNLQDYSLTSTQTNNCTIDNSNTISCNSKENFGGVYSVSFKSHKEVPGAYVIMPPVDNPSGIAVSAVGGSCSQTAPEAGQTYVCNFTISSNGTASAGKTLYLQVNGALGTANIITINVQ